MWRLWNKLFGWHYVVLRSPAMDHRYTQRLRKTHRGDKYIAFAGDKIWFLLDDGKVDNGYSWTALTF